MEMVLQFLCARYPHYFSLDTAQHTFHNRILDTTTHLQHTAPLHVLLQNVPEDFALMQRDAATGLYVFRAGIICSSIGWNLGSKLGLRLHEIHAPVPDYRDKMQFSMDRYFARMPAAKPIQRGSWGFELGTPLYHGPGEPFPSIEGLGVEEVVGRIHLRVDWQTLRRLPVSGAIAFNYKALFSPLKQLRKEPYIPSIALKVLKEGKENIMSYKGTQRIEEVLVPTLERYSQEQVDQGIVPVNWEVRTLDESPFFPGWKQMWIAEQRAQAKE
jgi:hypothetical protein